MAGKLQLAMMLMDTDMAWELALLGGSGAVVILGGAVALVAERRRRPRRRGTELTRWTSAAPVALAVGLCLFALGWDVGAWCVAVGAVLAAAGLFGVVREIRGDRR